MGIGAEPKGRTGALRDDLRARARYCSKQPIEAPFPCDEFQFPNSFLRDKFIVSFRDAQDFINGLDPLTGDSLLSEHRGERPAQG